MTGKVSPNLLSAPRADVLQQLLRELTDRVSFSALANDVAISSDRLRELLESPPAKEEEADQLSWKLVRSANKFGFFDLLPRFGIPPVSYDINSSFDILAEPIGFDEEPPLVPLISRPTEIAGFPVDFPLGLPASVLAANAKWIEFYARRGFDILTYKTVRTEYRAPHPLPNWVFIKDPIELEESNSVTLKGEAGYWPESRETLTMANSFGVPSLAPDWWQGDVKRARDSVREGHQVLIVSVVASRNDTDETIIEDFVYASHLAKEAGADIIEANFSCPNVPGDPVGEVYEDVDLALRICQAIKREIGPTPLLIKIGYMESRQLERLVFTVAEFIDGVVAINTMSARVIQAEEEPTFPGRESAGISGWAIRARGQEVARNLVAIRETLNKTLNKRISLLGLGGVLDPMHAWEYLDIGVDGVESCTGAFLDPYLGLKMRLDKSRTKGLSRVGFEVTEFGRFLKDVALHPSKPLRW